MERYEVEVTYQIKFTVPVDMANSEIDAINKAKHKIEENIEITVENNTIHKGELVFDMVTHVQKN